jgi:hypothetical protein
MLRWTCRLRNVLERRGSLAEISASRVPEMREAEFVTSESGTFPNEFRWDTFQASCDSLGRCTIFLDHRSASSDRVFPVDENRTAAWTVGSLSWRPLLDFSETGINILWLSSTIFISPILFCTDDGVLHEYTIGFRDRTKDSATQYLVYSLSAFQGGAVHEPSLLPLLFFTHLTAILPIDYFSKLSLQRVQGKLHLCPVDCIIHFLSIISSSNLLQVTSEEKVTTFSLLSDMNADELRVVLSHRFLPTVKLAIDNVGVDATVSLDIIVDSLKDAPHLRAIELPQHFLRAGAAEDLARMREITVKFPRLSVRMGYGDVLPSTLHKISRIHPANEIVATFDWELLEKYQQRPAKVVGSFLHPFLEGQLASESLRVSFECKRGNSKRVADLVASEIILCESKSLCFFNFTEGICKAPHDDIRNFDRIMLWDQGIFPSVVLNCFRKRLEDSVDLRVLPIAIGAVNHGNIYRKATDHVPYDMSIANASVIFRCIKMQSCAGFPGLVQTQETSFRERGRKRSTL